METQETVNGSKYGFHAVADNPSSDTDRMYGNHKQTTIKNASCLREESQRSPGSLHHSFMRISSTFYSIYSMLKTSFVSLDKVKACVSVVPQVVHIPSIPST